MLTEALIDAKKGDWTIPQHWERFTPAEHAVWDLLFARQQDALKGRAVSDFFRGLDVLRLSKPGIPDFEELNERLFARTGWTIVPVPGLVPDDVFGHVPLLAQPAVADFMQAMGAEGLAALEAGALHRLARLYWYSVEFGLAREAGGTRIYGAGLLSSFGESRFALESDKPNRQAFDLHRVLRTRYRSDAFQRGYFVIDSFDALLRLLADADLAGLYEEMDGTADLEP